MKKLLFFIFLFISTISFAQSGYVAGNMYYEQGGSNVTCGYSYSKNYYDSYYNMWRTGYFQTCKEQVWSQKFYSGYIYMWNGYSWYTEYRQGYFWYFYWNTL